GMQDVVVVPRNDFFRIHGNTFLLVSKKGGVRPHLLPVAAAGKPGAGTPVGEQLQQHGVGDTAVDDDGLVHALVDGVGHAVDLGDHPARDDAGVLVALDLAHVHLGDQGALVV